MRNLLRLLIAVLVVSCQQAKETHPPEAGKEAPSELPFTQVSLSDLSGFKPAASNWSVAGGVLSDYTKEQDISTTSGKGVLVNQNDETNKEDLYTAWEHGDLEIKLEFMAPKGSNSGIYFQGRYEVQILDSWLKEEVSAGDCGGIYERWDESRPEGEKGYEGYPPRMNASKAPGLWQQFHIIFRAPRFDRAGKKTENARFEKVALNGVIIHEDVELSGPTRSAFFQEEGPLGPLVIQGDHGPVAFRNIQYKRYFDELRLELNDLHYQYFEIDGPITQLPDFAALEMIKEGSTDSLVYQTISERNEQVAYIFTGQLEVPKAGDYLFTVYSDDGSQLFIDGAMLVDNDGKHDYEPKSGLIHLPEGKHEFRLTYFNYTWGQGLTVFYEGPEMRQQPLVSRLQERSGRRRPLMEMEPGEGPEMVRSFVMHQGEKLTHAISVGDPAGLHYSVDLRRGGLLQFWRGDFADVTEMWFQRGQPQLLQPMEMAVQANTGLLAAVLADPETSYPTEHGEQLLFKAYDINDAGQPVFSYQLGDALVSDQYEPDGEQGEIIRTISTDKGVDNLYTRIAADEYIKAVGNGYYTVAGNYYIRLLEGSPKPLIRKQGDREEMLFPLTDAAAKVVYAILW